MTGAFHLHITAGAAPFRQGPLPQIVDVQGMDGSPPYLVRWERGDQEGLFFPSPGALLQPKP